MKFVRKTKEEKECGVLLWCWDSEVLISLFDLQSSWRLYSAWTNEIGCYVNENHIKIIENSIWIINCSLFSNKIYEIA